MTLGICGARSTIATELADMVPSEEITRARPATMPLNLARYLVCTGYLVGKPLGALSEDEADLTWRLNFLSIASFLDRLFDHNSRARVVVLGSESAYRGSFDTAYAAAKAALHHYVETKQLRCPDQMLVALAPHIIIGTAMTDHRDDLSEVMDRGRKNRTKRWLTAREVATEAHHLLYNASVSLSGQVIRMRP